jgi:hypothetical protein
MSHNNELDVQEQQICCPLDCIIARDQQQRTWGRKIVTIVFYNGCDNGGVK